VVTTQVSFTSFSSTTQPAPLWTTLVNGVDVSPEAVGTDPVAPFTAALPAGTSSVRYETFIPNFLVLPQNQVDFTVRAPWETAALPVGTELLLGSLTLRNGSWSGSLASLAFSVTVLLDGDVVGTWSDVLEHRTLVGSTPEENADSFGFRDHPSLGTVRVLEAASATVEVFGRIGSLVPTRFGAVTGDGFLAGPSGTVPLPATLLLALAALGAAALASPRRREARL
jgi:hypothetical protein